MRHDHEYIQNTIIHMEIIVYWRNYFVLPIYGYARMSLNIAFDLPKVC